MYNVHQYQSCMLQVDYRSTAAVNLGCPGGGGGAGAGWVCGREREREDDKTLEWAKHGFLLKY